VAHEPTSSQAEHHPWARVVGESCFQPYPSQSIQLNPKCYFFDNHSTPGADSPPRHRRRWPGLARRLQWRARREHSARKQAARGTSTGVGITPYSRLGCHQFLGSPLLNTNLNHEGIYQSCVHIFPIWFAYVLITSFSFHPTLVFSSIIHCSLDWW
jgi:hypothetical protein